MADKVTTTKELKLVAKFVDEDDRTLTLDNPKTNVGAEQVKNLESVIKASNILIGDKAGADFYGIETAKVVEKEVTNFDLR